jgi:hypothetical protein
MKLVPSDGISRPYRLMETYTVSEGMRTRICSGAFATFNEAQTAKEDLEVNTLLSETPNAA